LTDETIPYDLKALEYRTEQSDISGDTRVIFGNKPLDVTVPMYNTFRVTKEVTRPVYYIVPPQWKEAIAVLEAHGLALQPTREAMTLDVESYRFSKVEWPAGPFEGRFMPKFQAELIKERRTFPTGSIIVPLDNHLAKLAVNLLEPEAPDSLLAWGFFNAIFEQKEYGEAYVLENLAREMLSSNSALREEFVRKLESDAGFASSPDRRLQFFYERSPYWDPYMNVYPVGRIMTTLPGTQF
jgi:hypothetical protein